MTNNHVIEGADEISVILQDNTTLKAEVVGRDETGDLALLKVKADKPLPTVDFGDSDTARVGDWVLAIGNPFGLGGTVTAGIVSARSRDIRQGPYDDFIQTDAAINRGNSGGPLFNMDGKVIGINTAIFSPSGGSIGIGFSIPSNMAKTIVMQLKQFGHPRRGWLGVRIQQVTPELAESVGLKDTAGRDGRRRDRRRAGGKEQDQGRRHHPEVRWPGREGHARSAAHRRRDRRGQEGPGGALAGWQGPCRSTRCWMKSQATRSWPRSTPAKKAPDAPSASRELTDFGMQIAPITQDLKDRFQIGADQKGVVITDVKDGGVAADRGLKPGDVIVEVQQADVTSPDDVTKKVEAQRAQDRKSVLMLIQGQDGVRYVPLPLTKGGKDTKPG